MSLNYYILMNISNLYFYPLTGIWTIPLPNNSISTTAVKFVEIDGKLAQELLTTGEFEDTYYMNSDEHGVFLQFRTK